jgi:CubicO group peptidase (beta-lactamase class C family)
MTSSISEFLQDRIDANDFPSAVYAVSRNGRIVLQDSLGFAVRGPNSVKATSETIYDLASLTKVLVTGLLAAKLLENGAFALSDNVARFLHEFDTEEKRSITVENLLTHTSVLCAWKPFYLLVDEPAGILPTIAGLKADNPVGTKVVYSDLNFLVLKELIEKSFGKTIDEAAREQIFEPLGLKDTFFNPPKELLPRIAASENGNVYERNTCLELGFDVEKHAERFRTNLIHGEVHDGNCYFMNGVSSHAGLFSTAAETVTIAEQFLASRSSVLKPETCAIFRKNFTPGLNEARSIGFQLAETPESTAGSKLAKDSFGHLGFTGTSVWVEPQSDSVFVLLTNRTHDHELPFVNINSTRRTFHDLASQLLSGA